MLAAQLCLSMVRAIESFDAQVKMSLIVCVRRYVLITLKGESSAHTLLLA